MSLVHLTSFHDPCRPPIPPSPPPDPHGAVCHIGPVHGIATCPTERGNGIVQSFTSPALRLTESIKQARPPHLPIPSLPLHLPLLSPPSFPIPRSPFPPLSLYPSLHFCQLTIRPNYYCVGMPAPFPGSTRSCWNKKHGGANVGFCGEPKYHFFSFQWPL